MVILPVGLVACEISACSLLSNCAVGAARGISWSSQWRITLYNASLQREGSQILDGPRFGLNHTALPIHSGLLDLQVGDGLRRNHEVVGKAVALGLPSFRRPRRGASRLLRVLPPARRKRRPQAAAAFPMRTVIHFRDGGGSIDACAEKVHP